MTSFDVCSAGQRRMRLLPHFKGYFTALVMTVQCVWWDMHCLLAIAVQCVWWDMHCLLAIAVQCVWWDMHCLLVMTVQCVW